MAGGRSEPWWKPAVAICIVSDVQLPVPGNIPSVCWTIEILADIWFTCNSFPHMKKIWFQSRYLILCAFSCSHIHVTDPICATNGSLERYSLYPDIIAQLKYAQLNIRFHSALSISSSLFTLLAGCRLSMATGGEHPHAHIRNQSPIRKQMRWTQILLHLTRG